MSVLTRRSLLQKSAALAAVSTFAAPHLAKADTKTASVWWVQGFAQEEDIAFKKVVDDFQKQSGNTIDYTIIPYAPMRQKIVSAITSGVVPDIIQNTPVEIIALWAWDDKLLPVDDVIEKRKKDYTETAVASAYCYNNATKKRAYYGVPFTTAGLPNHVWKPLIEKAGYKMEDIPKTWDAYYDFFKEVQKGLRKQGVRNVYGVGWQITTNGNDPNNIFNYLLAAYGGLGMVTPDGKLHLDDPKVKEAVIKALDYPTKAYKEGFVPPGAINWNDADDNNAFHAKQIVMDLDGTISTEVAIYKNKQDYDDIVVMGLPLSNDGKPVPSVVNNLCGLIPKGAKNVEVAKEFLSYLVQPEVNNEYLKVGLGRNIPATPSIVKNDPWWMDDPHRKTYVEQCLLGPTVPEFWVYNPAYAQVRNEHAWSVGWADIIQKGMSHEAAAEKAFKRVEEIFAKYPIAA